MDCVFCKIKDGQLPSHKVYEDSKTLAFLDINPVTPGHCLVVPKIHSATIFEIELPDLMAVSATAKKVAIAVKNAFQAEGVNILQANGAAAFQSVTHFHFHVIPRWGNDGKGFDWKLVRGDSAQLKLNVERILAVIR